jgi:predicted transcriptional regulator
MKSLAMKDQISLLKASVDEMNTWNCTKQVDEWNEWRRRNRHIKPCLDNIDLSGRNLSYANFRETSLKRTNFSFCRLVETDFVRSDLRGSAFLEAYLYGALFDQAILHNAKLMKATLWWVTLVETDLANADISGCKVYGVSPWNANLDGARQVDLEISRYNEPRLTVDNLEVAHFIYLLHNNKKLRNIIDTVTSKVVLILGRFTTNRKQILESLKDALRERNYLPLVFDFEPSEARDLTETVQLMASMAKFVIADITDAKSIPQELSHIIPNFPSVPVQPILLGSDYGYAMFDHWSHYKSVLPVIEYENEQDLLNRLNAKLIAAVNAWKKGHDEASQLRDQNNELQKKIKALEARLAREGERT